MTYKSTCLLRDAIHGELENLRKTIMRVVPQPGDSVNATVEMHEHLKELRKLIDQLGEQADRQSIDDVAKLSPGDYVATMKPLVGNYHRQLMVVDRLTACLCEDLQATGCILMLIGDGKTIVRTAVDPNRPEAQLAIEALLGSLDSGTKQVVADGVVEAEKQLGITVPSDPGVSFVGPSEDGEADDA